MKSSTLFAIILLTLPSTGFSYWNEAHKKFARFSIGVTELGANPGIVGDNAVIRYYQNRFGFSLEKTSYIFDNIQEFGPGESLIEVIQNDKQEWLKIISEGASDEDYPLYRPLNHFFDPKNNHSLLQTLQTRGYTISPSLIDLLSSSANTPDWALEDNGTILKQNYSLRDSQDLLYKALTSTFPDTRYKLLGEHFYALAHVLHLLADMGQPEHVRNDIHPPFPPSATSLYEKYTDDLVLKNKVNFMNIYNNNKYVVDKSKFKKPRDFWINNGIGLAEYTNANFVSPDTNFDTNYYTLPSQGIVDKASVDVLYQEINKPVPTDFRGQKLAGDVEFIATTIQDQQTSPTQTFPNPRASSYSIFNREVTSKLSQCTELVNSNELNAATVEMMERECKRYTLNRWNFDKFHEFIAPRIIGYGAAFLSHLYRGNIDFLPPTSAQASDFRADPLVKGVSQLPLMLKNTTPTTPKETMGPGKLVAVITYVNGNNEVVEAITSDEITGAALSTTNQPFTFKFTNKAFPLSREGLTAYIQVIFRGQLGDDEDTIVVARKPLNEIIQPFTLTANLPDSGVYAAIDHSDFNAKFSSLTMKLSSSEQIGGTLVPSASYHKDNCLSYYINCNGSYSRTTESFTSISNAFPADALNLPTTMTFANGIPPNATDLFINFINFKTDPTQPVGIAFVDISEPTFISFINSTDYTSFESEYKSYQEIEAILTTESELIPRIKPDAVEVEILFGTNTIVSAKIGRLPIAQYSRIAILTDVTEFSLTYNVKRLDVNNTNPTSKQAWYPATVHQNITLADGLKYHYYSGVNKLRNVISNINILLEYTPILPLSGKTADTSILPDATLSDEAPVIY